MFDRRRALESADSDRDAREMLAEVRADILHADQKGALVLATLGLAFGVLLTGVFEGRLAIGGSWSGWDAATMASILWWAGVAAAGAACFCAASAVWPRYRAPKTEPARIEYWGDAAWYRTLPAFLRGWKHRDATESRSTAQLWFLSVVVVRKYRFIRASMVSTAVAGVLLAVAAILNGR